MKFVPMFLSTPQWSKNGQFCLSTPDGGFLYIGSKNVNYVNIKDEVPIIKIFHTKQPIVSIDIDPQWNTEGEHLFATLTYENSILIFDFDKEHAITGHKAHCRMHLKDGLDTQSTVHISFMKNRNLLSISANDICFYCIASNTLCVRPNFISHKRYSNISALKCSPYDENIFAIGMSNGLVLVCDAQKTTIQYTLRGHNSAVVSLSWMLMSTQQSTEKNNDKVTLGSAETEEIFNIYDYDYLENEFGTPLKTDDKVEEKPEVKSAEAPMNSKLDFQEACENLKQDICELSRDNAECDANFYGEVTLADCQDKKNLASRTSTVESIISSQESLELIEHNSSTDDSQHVDGIELKAHDAVDNKMAACSAPENNSDDHETDTLHETMADILLATGSNDGHIWIWNAVKGGSCDHLKSGMRGSFNNLNSNAQILWRSSTELISVGPRNALTQWTLLPLASSDARSSSQYKFAKKELQQTEIKCLCFGIYKDQDLLWYISKDREIVCENIKTGTTIISYATATSNIQVARESPENNSKIAFGYADRRIVILDTSRFSVTTIATRKLTVRLNSAVKTLAWHENGIHLAYGTCEGQVGVIDIDTQRDFLYNTVCGKPIYSLAWRGNHIFQTCNDKLSVYEMGNRDALNLRGVKPGVSTIAVHEGLLFIGTSRGFLHIYRENTSRATESKSLTFDLIQNLEVAKHYITEIAWNPIKKNQFAMVATEGTVYILNFDSKEAKEEKKLKVNGPKASISLVKWSNRDQHKFVTCGNDGALRVWDLSRQMDEELIYVKQFHCPLYSVLLLPTDEQYVICTGKSITIEIINTADPASVESSAMERSLDYIKWATKLNVNTATGGTKRRAKKRGKKDSTELGIAEAVADELTTQMGEMALVKTENQDAVKPLPTAEHKCQSEYLKNPPTLMNLITKEQNKNALDKLYAYLTGNQNVNILQDGGVEHIFVKKLFGTKKDAEQLLAAELESLKLSSTFAAIGNLFMSQANGSIRDVILKAIQTRTLNEWHVSVAPTVSYDFWQKCCTAFAEQLLEQGYALQAAVYLLSLHKQNEAMQQLMAKNYFKEALLIGRIYLCPGDTMLNHIVDKWIEQLEGHGNLPGAALICAVSEQYNRGYEILAKQRSIGPEVERIVKLLREKSSDNIP